MPIGHIKVIAKKEPSVYRTPVADHESPLKKFICVAEDMPLILGPRRFPPIPCPPANTNTSIALLTSVGFTQLSAHDYVKAIQKLRPDIAVGMVDLANKQPGSKRRGKMVDRTHAWTRDALEQLYGDAVAEKDKSKSAYFAPVLPLDNAQQSLYLDDLESEFRWDISGLALYESASLEFVPESLAGLPRLLFSEPETPHTILRDISLGADLLTTPLLGASSDGGIAMEFVFPAPAALQEGKSKPQPLGIDMWTADHATDISPLGEGCECYTCKNYHRAYIHHLLLAKEMTAWALLQVHNFHVMDTFFARVRDSIQHGSFEQDVQTFARVYAPSMPESSGEGPRYVNCQFSMCFYFKSLTVLPDYAVINYRPTGLTSPDACPRYMALLTMLYRNSPMPSLKSLPRTPTRAGSRNTGLLRSCDGSGENRLRQTLA